MRNVFSSLYIMHEKSELIHKVGWGGRVSEVQT